MAGSGGGFFTPNYTAADPAAYPLPTLTYGVFPTSKLKSGLGETLRGFLAYAAGHKGQDGLPAGYVALPATLAAQSAKVAKDVPLTPKTHPSPSPTPSPSPSPSPSPTGTPRGGTSGGGGGGGGYTGGGGGVIPGGVTGGHPVGDGTGSGGGTPSPTPIQARFLASMPLAASGSNPLLIVLLVIGLLGITAGPVLILTSLISRRAGVPALRARRS
jgi:hypothetical protein